MKKQVGVGVGIMIMRDNKVLLGQRHHDRKKAGSRFHAEGTWTLPGGKVDYGETLEMSAIREIAEETGLRVDKKQLKLVSLSDDRAPEAHFVSVGFLIDDFVGEPEVLEPDTITKWHWFPLDELPQPMYFPSQRVIENYQRGIIYQENK
ncbi:NUDIX hydrolase [Patescibacteria group bacterium]